MNDQQHDMDTAICDWCHMRVSIESLIGVPMAVDEDSGMVESEGMACSECLAAMLAEQEQHADEIMSQVEDLYNRS